MRSICYIVLAIHNITHDVMSWCTPGMISFCSPCNEVLQDICRPLYRPWAPHSGAIDCLARANCERKLKNYDGTMPCLHISYPTMLQCQLVAKLSGMLGSCDSCVTASSRIVPDKCSLSQMYSGSKNHDCVIVTTCFRVVLFFSCTFHGSHFARNRDSYL